MPRGDGYIFLTTVTNTIVKDRVRRRRRVTIITIDITCSIDAAGNYSTFSGLMFL